jgi:O-acetyl-ADP-ribose deacetylase (regulator of RNase III)
LPAEIIRQTKLEHPPLVFYLWMYIILKYKKTMKKQVGEIILEAVHGDIASQTDVTAVVNAANAQLMPGGGVAGVIHRAAGPKLAEECRHLAPIEPGQAVISGGHNLPNKYVIHCLGPVYGKDKPENLLLADCYKNALRLADEKEIESVAFPAISTGAFGYPFEAATDIALQTVQELIPELKFVKHIRFVLFGGEDFEVYVERLRRIK